MDDKELLKRLKELLNERMNMLEEQGDKNKDESREMGGMQKSLGAHPKVGRSPINNEEFNNPQRGYSSFFMLCFLTFFFETLFLVISYLIFK